jgi:hypothetical protein
MATLSEEELYMAKEECGRLGECTATYYIVNLLSEVESARAERKRSEPVASASINDCFSCAGKGCILCDFTGHN